MTPRLLITAAACLSFLARMGEAAPPALTYLFPAGARQGQTVEVEAGGTFERWPVRVHVEGKGLAVEPAKTKGKLSIRVSADAVPGVNRLRLHDDEGATARRPFIVGTLPELAEVEPNGQVSLPQVLPSPAVTVNGRLEKADDVDCFGVELVRGQTLVASLAAYHRLRSPMDAVLQIVSPAGFVLDENHDTHELDPQVVFTAPADGAYVVRIFTFPSDPNSTIRFAGGDAYVYRLTMTTGGFVDHPMPLAVNRAKPGPVGLVGWNLPPSILRMPVSVRANEDAVTIAHPLLANTSRVRIESVPTASEVEPNDRDRPQAVTLPVAVSGVIDEAGDTDYYRFRAKKGEKWAIKAEAQPFGSPLEPALRLPDGPSKPQPAQRGRRRGRNAPRTQDAEAVFTAPADGDFQVGVSDLYGHGGMRYVYLLRIAAVEPDFGLTVAADSFTVTPGKPLDIPVAVERRNGFDKPIEVMIDGLREGVAAPSVTATGNANSTATLKVSAAKGPISMPIRIRGVVKATGVETVRPALATVAPFAEPHGSLWLTVLKAIPVEAKPTAKTK